MTHLGKAIIGVAVAPALVAMIVIGMLLAGAGAASPSQADCEASGGTFSRVNGQVSCTTTEHVGNSDNSQTTDTSESSNGTLDNKPKHAESCDGPGNSGDGYCPL